MHKFIPTHRNRNTHVLVTNYSWPIEEKLKGHAILVHVNCLEDISNIIKHTTETTQIHGFVYTDKYASLETIDINPEWSNYAVFLYINRLGQFRNVQEKISNLRSLNVIVVFTGPEHQATVDAQILSSLGIHTGISLNPDSPLDESVLDLITYNFYSMMPHGEIEPFSTMERYYDGESYVNPKLAKFENPLRYIYVDKDLHLAFSREDLDKGVFFGQGLEEIANLSSSEVVEKKMNEWQEMFIEPHPCTFCPAFRVCMGYFEEQRETGRCRKFMTELLESIEFSKKKSQNNKRERCQL